MLENIAVKYYNMGYNCAETLFLAGNEMYNLGYDEKSARLFAAFGGGLQCGDLCGCLSGAAGVLGAMFVVMMVWFSCYNLVLTSDKFVCLFGSLIPSLSLLLVMVLRLIPSFMRKTKQISDARNSIGKGGNQHASMKDKAMAGMTVLSALTDWALEGSIVTADSMRSRGYGSAKRTSFRQYKLTGRDYFLLALEAALSVWVIAAAAAGAAEITFAPYVTMAYITPAFGGYCVLLLLPTAIEIKEALQWHIIRSKI